MLVSMSRAATSRIDRASQTSAISGTPGSILEFTTTDIRPSERLAFWRDSVLKRMVPLRALDKDRPFQARLRRVVGAGVEMVEHCSDALIAERTESRCAADAIDDFAIDLMLDCASAQIDHVGQRKIRVGDACLVDYARPVQVIRSRHRAIGLIIARRQLSDALGAALPSLGGRILPMEGMATLLRSHLRATLEEAPRLSTAERLTAVAAGVDMALAVLQAEQRGAADIEQFEGGFYHAACRLIERDCADPDLTPEVVAVSLGSSRASLYRVFFRHGESVSAMIWIKRLERAWRMLTTPGHGDLLISEIAFRSGFLDQPTFNRMFKRRFARTPREARNEAQPQNGQAPVIAVKTTLPG